ncbi:MAG: hypothetical protein ACJ742_21495 [Actinomycetes bacterium]
MPTPARPAVTLRPKISQMQISADRSASMTSRRVPSPSRYLAAEASRKLDWGR